MQDITITIRKANVMEEVAKTTAYIGAKTTLSDGKKAFDQVFVTDEDKKMVERFWTEAADVMTNLTRRFITSVSDVTIDGSVNYVVNLSMSDRYDKNLTDSITTSMFSFFVSYIIGKWCEIVAKDDVKEYSDNATAMMESITQKLYHKIKPKRTTINE